MAKLVKYFVSGTPSNGKNYVEFNLDYASAGVTLDGSEVIYSGSGAVENVWVNNRNLSFNFTFASTGTDRLYLSANYADYTITKSFSTVLLTDNTTGAVIKVAGGTTSAFDQIVFANGMVGSKALLDSIGSTPPVLDTGTKTPADAQTLYTNLGTQSTGSVVKAFGNNDGNVFATVPMKNVALVVSGGSGIDVVYVKPYSNVDATGVSTGVDRIYLTGNMSDYTGSRSFSNFTLTRSANAGADVETVKLAGGSTTAYDWVIFADGHVKSIDLFNAIKNNTAWPTLVTTDFTVDDLGVTTQVGSGVTPGLQDIQNITTINVARASGYYKAGETITFAVDMKEDVTIVGTPRLKVEVGNTAHELAYVSSGSTARRLLFQYLVTPTDSDLDGASIPNGAAAFILDAGVSIKYTSSNTDALLTHDPIVGFVRARIDNFSPTGAPDIVLVTDNEGTTAPVSTGGTSNDSTPTVRVNLTGTGARVGDRIQLYNDQVVLGAAVLLTQQNIIDTYVDVTTTSLPQSTYLFKAKLITPADTPSALSSTAYTVTLDLTTPTVSITSVTDDTAPQIGNVSNGGYSNDTQLTVRVNLSDASVAVGDTVQLLNGSTAISAVLTVTGTDKNTNGYIDITTNALSNDTTYAITVKATDAVGNSSTSATHTVTIDTVAPTAVTLALQQDTGSSATDNITRNGTITIGGLEVGATWEYSTNGGTSWVAGNSGAAATTSTGSFTLTAGNYTQGSVMVRQTDQAGNVGAAAALGNTVLGQQRLQGMSGNLADYAPQMVAMTDGGYVLTWYGYTSDNKGFDIFVQRFDVHNVAVGSLQRLQGAAANSNSQYDLNPQIIALANGEYVVVWSGETSDSQGTDIFLQRVDASNIKVGNVIRLQGEPGYKLDVQPQIAALSTGGYAIAWQGSSSTTSEGQWRDIFVRTYDSENNSVGGLQHLQGVSGDFLDDAPQITSLPDGGFVVVWEARTSTSYWSNDIFVQRFTNSGTTVSSLQRLGGSGTYDEDHTPQVIAMSDGGYLVTWSGYLSGVGRAIFLQRFNADGVTTGTLQSLKGTVDGIYSYSVDEPQITALQNGGYVVIWKGDTNDLQGTDIFVQHFNSTNEAVVPIQRLHGLTGLLFADVPQIMALSGGGYVVVWQEETSGQGTDIFLQQFSSDGSANGGIKRFQGVAGNYADITPQLVELSDGGFELTWSAQTNNGQFYDIFTQRFDAQGNYAQTLTVDTTGPIFSSGSVNGSVLTLIYGETLDANALPDVSRFTVTSDGSVIAVTSVSASGSTLTLNLASRVGYQKAVTVTYTDPSTGDDANAMQDQAGNDAATLAAISVTNNSPLLAPTLSLQADTGSSSTDGITRNGTVVVSGLEAGATWQYSTNSGSTWIAGVGNSFTLSDGTYTNSIYIKQTLNTQTSSNGYYSGTVTVDTTAPTSVIKGFDKYGYTWNGVTESYLTDIVGAGMTDTSSGYSAVLEGTSEAYATVTFNIAGQVYTATADSTGYWYYRLTDTDFANVGYGAETITVTGATDRAGNASSAQVTRNVTFNAVADTMSHAESGYGSDYIDALVYGGAGWKGTTITYSFAPGSGSTVWTTTEKQAFANACHAYENICNVHFVEGTYYANDYQETSIVVNKVTSSAISGAAANFYLPTDGINSYYGAVTGNFAYDQWTWSDLSAGGYGFLTIIHELGHGLGLSHPFDGYTVFPGVVNTNPGSWSGPFTSGNYGLNDGINTIMSYNHNWEQDLNDSNYWGYSKTPMSFDVATMQAMYGANTSYRTDNNLYQLPTTEATGLGWECIWDAGGTDTITNAGASSACVINLNAYPKIGGVTSTAYISYNVGASIGGGFTIADGAIIENAIGGNGADTITGNGVSNTLTGNGGADKFVFNTALGASNVDTLTDFSVAQGDKLQLDDAIFSSLLGTTTVTSSRFRSGAGVTAAVDADDYLIYNTSTGALYYDRDGSAAAYAPIQFALLQNKAALAATSFAVI